MKIIKIMNVFIIAVILAINCYATGISDGIEVYNSENISIMFSDDTLFDVDEQKVIADIIIYGYGESEVEPCNILCDLLGHNLTEEYVQATEHKVDDLSPRCLKKIYEVSSCSRCDYAEVELYSQIYIECCPEE